MKRISLYWTLGVLALAGAGAYLYASSVSRPGDEDAPWHSPLEVTDEPISPIPVKRNLDPEKVALGKRLFGDTQLSRDDTISCASCHDLARGGVDGLPRSRGIGGAVGGMNAPTVYNSGLNFRQFWNGRAATLEDQIDGPVQNSKEMGARWPDVIARLKKDTSYSRDFGRLYSAGISQQTIKDAIATFERSLLTPNGKFDRYLRGEKNALDTEELAGYESFKKLGCISCHQGVNVGGNMYERLGLVDDYFMHRGHIQEEDLGRFSLTHKEENRYEFRVPSLRNVALTAPYFHDASAATLEEAVSIMAKYQLGVVLQRDEIARIVKFLNTLTGELPASETAAR